MTTVWGIVINIHHHGGTVRLANGSLATIPVVELLANRSTYAASLAKREPLEFAIDRHGGHRVAALAALRVTPVLAAPASSIASDVAFEARIGAYLKATQEWAPPDQAPPAERHFIRKKRRARLFEARGDAT